MNRIILIGNGFDLAHGLKTRYADFIDWFWKEEMKDFCPSKDKKDNEPQQKKNIGNAYEDDFIKAKIDNWTDVGKFKKQIEEYRNNFLRVIEQSRNTHNWADIEELYFEELIKAKNIYLELKNRDKKEDAELSVKKLNDDFDKIKYKLREYLQQEYENLELNGGLKTEFEKIIFPDKANTGTTLLLTFNFTETEQNYKGGTIKHIHGVLADFKTMIFGYGDEYGDESKAIENLNYNEFLKNVKSIKYNETDTYRYVMNFIDENEYEIVILGHSCGLCDRTLLNNLFENKNCKNIKVYYHQNEINREVDNYNDINCNIYRVFNRDTNSKNNNRSKVIKQGIIPTLARIQQKAKTEKEQLKALGFLFVEANIDYKLMEVDVTKHVDSFYIGEHQVTQQQWNNIMGNNPSYFQNKKVPQGVNSENLPVERVSWYDVIDFCNKLSEKYELRKYYNRNGNDVTINPGANGFRLPTEAEWEYVARGGKESKNYKYSGGNNLSDVGWYYENSGNKKLDENDWKSEELEKNNCRPHEVGQLGPNELGIFDMSGNVWEWCEDWYDKGRDRVLRGGSWIINAEYCRVSYRFYNDPGYRYNYIGFRLARSL